MYNKKAYIDMTRKWKLSREKAGSIVDAKSIIINRQQFFVNNKNKINHKNNETLIALLLVKSFGGNLQYLPDIGEIDGYRLGDFYYKNEIWEAKELGINAKSKTRAIDNLLKSSKGQANNFVIDITNCKINKRIIIKQIKKIYSTKNRYLINIIIVFKKNKVLKVYYRNNKRD